LAIYHLGREDNRYGVNRAVNDARAAIPTFILIFDNRRLVFHLTINNITRAEKVTNGAAINAGVFINQDRHN
jgi:hypothetical protein